MAFFGVTKEVIATLTSIDGADRIEVASLEGNSFRFVVGKGVYASGVDI